MVTRAEVAATLASLNAAGTRNRKEVLRTTILKDYAPKVVAMVLSDLDSYPEWKARMDLEDPS